MFDVIVVGARCAGAPTAMILARLGYRVLLLDRATFPSNKPLSTHGILKSGCAVLERLGLLQKVIASNCPPATAWLMDVGPVQTTLASPPVAGINAMYTPRRTFLDAILVEGAVSSGAELREHVMITEILRGAHGEVIGVRGHDIDTQTPFDEHATIVVGADGIHSIVARSVGAEIYEEVPLLTGCYWSYWEGVPLAAVIELHRFPGRILAAAATNDDLTIVMDYFPVAKFAEFKADVEGHFYGDHRELAPAMHDKLRAGRRVERWLGTGYQPNFFHKPYGPGWALVGDADIHHDSGNPSGISYAFVNAELLASAIDEGLSGRQPLAQALAEYERRRAARWLPHYRFVTGLLQLDAPLPPPVKTLLDRIAADPAGVGGQFMGLFEGDETCFGLLDTLIP